VNKIKYLPIYTEAMRRDLSTSLAEWQAELGVLLPNLPRDITLEFDNDQLVPGSGTGGVAWNLRELKLALDPGFNETHEELFKELKAVYFHESYHLARKFSFATTPSDLPALSHAIEEGAATKFEMAYGGVTPRYGKYEDRKTMLRWLEEVKALPDGFDYDWERWKFFDPETKREWILYKVGLFIVDEALEHNQTLSIEAMSKLSSDEIFKQSTLS
jgi:hypothetical protein